ncbi:MAG: SDR family NAD(P)-dependent oxidoreductase [Actinobacteria bacterium]|nr:SDR family NAD(P)-dependent oxidoreductase [Actinomycetota bacterium]
MSGQVALVTGGVHGVGRAIAETLMGAGARVAAGYARSWTAAEAFFVEHGTHGVSIHQGHLDLAEDCDRVVEEVLDRHGRLDILVNAAGVVSESMSLLEPAQRARAAEINLAGAYSMVRAVRTHMERNGHGRIIGITPVGDPPGLGSGTMATQATLTPHLADELQGTGVTIACIVPTVAITEPGTGARAELDTISRLVLRLAGPEGADHHGQVHRVADMTGQAIQHIETTKWSSQ